MLYLWVRSDIQSGFFFQEAAEFLLKGLDFNFDPCEDFYMFTCNKYLNANPLPSGTNRIGTYSDTQRQVNNAVALALNTSDNLLSNTEKILQKVSGSSKIGINKCWSDQRPTNKVAMWKEKSHARQMQKPAHGTRQCGSVYCSLLGQSPHFCFPSFLSTFFTFFGMKQGVQCQLNGHLPISKRSLTELH